MWRAAKRRMRDRKFVPFDRERLFARAFAVATVDLVSWDLFPPVRGYRPFSSSSPRSQLFSAQRQHSDWSLHVIERDNRTCQECGATRNLEAHHIWSQSWYPSLRYVLKNGRTLCHHCHERVKIVPEITPDQFMQLTADEELINANVAAVNFWSHFAGVLEKGRLREYGLHECGGELTPKEAHSFEQWAKLNDLTGRIQAAALLSPLARTTFQAQQQPMETNLHIYGRPTTT